jgi:WD domain, G-beta repeat
MKKKVRDDEGEGSLSSRLIKMNIGDSIIEVADETLLESEYNHSICYDKGISLRELQGNNDYFLEEGTEGFGRIIKYVNTGVLSTEGLDTYQEDRMYYNLDFLKIPYRRIRDYSRTTGPLKYDFWTLCQLNYGGLCGIRQENETFSICFLDIDIESMVRFSGGHSQCISSIIKIGSSKICSFSEDNTAKIWNVDSGECEQTFHNEILSTGLSGIQLMDGRVCLWSYDNETINLWNFSTGETISYSHCKEDFVAGMFCRIKQLKDGRLCGSGVTSSIKIWNLDDGACEMTLDGHSKGVLALIVIDELSLCSSSIDKTIKLWNISTGLCEKSLEGHTSGVTDIVLLADGRLCSVSFNGDVKIWSIETGVCDLTVHIGTELWQGIQLHDGRILITNTDSSVFIIGG